MSRRMPPKHKKAPSRCGQESITFADSCCRCKKKKKINHLRSKFPAKEMATVGIPAKRSAESDELRDGGRDTEDRSNLDGSDIESLAAAVRRGDVERVCLDSPWDWDAHRRRCVREALKPLLLLTVRARGSTECGGGGGGEETREGRRRGIQQPGGKAA